MMEEGRFPASVVQAAVKKLLALEEEQNQETVEMKQVMLTAMCHLTENLH